MGTIIDLSEYRRMSLAKSGQGRNHHVDHLENKTERHQQKPGQSRTHNKENIGGQASRGRIAKNQTTYEAKTAKKSLHTSSGGNAAATKSQNRENRLARGQMMGVGNAQNAGQNAHSSSGLSSAKTGQSGFKKAKIIDQQAGESLLAILYYAESEAKRLGIPDAATFIACAHEILRDYNLDVENPSQTNLKG